MVSIIVGQPFELAAKFTSYQGVFLSHVHADGEEQLRGTVSLRALR
jgi:hypothetical protein